MGKHEVDVVDAQRHALGAFDQIDNGGEAIADMLDSSVLVEDEVHEYFCHLCCVGSYYAGR